MYGYTGYLCFSCRQRLDFILLATLILVCRGACVRACVCVFMYMYAHTWKPGVKFGFLDHSLSFILRQGLSHWS